MLDLAIRDGFRDLTRFETDRAFAGARSLPEFKAVANRLRDSIFPSNPLVNP